MRRTSLVFWAFSLLVVMASQVQAFTGSVRTVRLDGPTVRVILRPESTPITTPWRDTREVCLPFLNRLKTYQEAVVAQDRVMVDYFGAMSVNLRDWDGRLSPSEGHETFVRPGVFDPIRESTERAFTASQSVYEVSNTFDSEWNAIQNGIASCLTHLDPEAREGLLAKMSDYNFFARENEVAVAGAMEILASRMDGWHNKWGALEGKTVQIPEDFFAPISETADKVDEIKLLIEEDMTVSSQSRLAELIEELQASFGLRAPVL